jgi:hypothetical protein
MILPVILASGSESEELITSVILLGYGLFWVLFGFSMLLSILLWFILPPAIAHLVDRRAFTAAFSPRRWYPILRANMAGFVVAYILLLGLFGLIYIVYTLLIFTFILCFIAPLILLLLSVYIYLAGAALIAQAYRDGKLRLEAASDPGR